MANKLTAAQEARRRQLPLIFGKLSPQTSLDVFDDEKDREAVWLVLGHRPEALPLLRAWPIHHESNGLADRIQGKLASPLLTDDERLHIWGAMDMLRTVEHCLNEKGEVRFHFRPDQAERLTRGIPSDPDEAVQHLHRCAMLTRYLFPHWGKGWSESTVDHAAVRDVFQPWFVREGRTLADVHRAKLPQRLDQSDNPLHPLSTWGFRGIAWNLAIYTERQEAAGEDLAEMMALLPVLCNGGRSFYDAEWYKVVGSACDVWSQRTGIELAEPVGVQVVRTGAAKLGWKNPRTTLDARNLAR